MPILVPGKRFAPRLAKSKVFGGGVHAKRGTVADLLITPLVDMFVIIVIFLLQNFSANGDILFMSKEIVLPAAENGLELLRAPAVLVSAEAVMLEGRPVALVADLERQEYWNIPALEEQLRDLRKRYEEVHAGARQGDLNIQADKDVPFRVLKRVMFASNQAGYLNLSYAVLQSGSGHAVAGR